MRYKLFLILLLTLIVLPAHAQSESVVHGVFFYSETCPHCTDFINNDYPSYVDEFGDQLDLLFVNTNTQEGRDLLYAAGEIFHIDRLAVPMLILEDTVMVGSGQINEQGRPLIRDALAGDGLDWPDIPGLDEMLANRAPQEDEQPVVRAVLFHSETCPHCVRFLEDDYPDHIDEFGEQFDLLMVNTGTPEGREMLLAAVDAFDARIAAVPMLIIDDTVMIGAGEINGQAPDLIRNALAADGLDWPDIPGLGEMLANRPTDDQPIVHAVLLTRDSCPHCRAFLEDDYPNFIEEFGDQFDLLIIDIANTEGQDLALATIEAFNIPANKQAVPMLIIGDTVMVGSAEINEEAPPLIREALAIDGLDWPDIPGLDPYITQRNSDFRKAQMSMALNSYTEAY